MQTIYLDIANRGVFPTIHAKQFDVGRKFLVVLTDAGVTYSPPAGSVFYVWYEGNSGEGNYTDIGDKSAFSVNGNKVTIELITQMLAVAGKGLLCIVLSSADGSQIASWNIDYLVESVPGANSEQAKQYYTAFSKAVADLPYPDASLTAAGKAADSAAVGAALTTKAPAGYGLGEPTSAFFVATENELNEALDSILGTMPVASVGFYRVIDNTGAVWGGGTLTASVFKTDDNYSTVEFYGYLSGGLRFSETKAIGYWSGLEWVNPPMAAGVEYRTTERWNGKVVYTTLINPGVLANEMLSVNHNITMTTPISCVAFVDGEHTIPAKYKDADYDQEVIAYTTYQNIFIYSNGMIDSIGKKVYCILKYLKD